MFGFILSILEFILYSVIKKQPTRNEAGYVGFADYNNIQTSTFLGKSVQP